MDHYRTNSRTVTASTASKRRNSRPHRTALMFLSPWILGFVLLTLFPFAASLYWSFCRYDLLSPPEVVGFANYQRLADEIVSGQGVAVALWNTSYYALVSVPLSIGLGIFLAVLLSWDVRGKSVYRALFFLPSVIPVVASSVLWMWMLDPRHGPINRLLGLVGLPTPDWFNSPREAFSPLAIFTGTAGFGSKDALVMMSLWGVGNFMIIYLAALSDVPKPLYEAAAIDGAGRWRRFWHITLPMLTPVILFNLIVGIIQSVQAFTQIYLVSEGRGAPNESTLVLSLHLFLAAFSELEMGYASAIAWLMLVVLTLITVALFRSARHWVHYQGLSR